MTEQVFITQILNTWKVHDGIDLRLLAEIPGATQEIFYRLPEREISLQGL